MMCPHFVALLVCVFIGRAFAGMDHSEATSLVEMRQRMDEARGRIEASTRCFHDPIGTRTWIDGSRLWFAETSREGMRRWWLVDATKVGDSAKKPLFDQSSLRGTVREVVVADGRVVVVCDIDGREEHFAFELAGGAPLAADAAVRRAVELRLTAAPVRSGRQGASSGIDFVNRLDTEVEVFWIDSRGESRSYGRIAAGATRRQHTFGGHAWLVRTSDGTELGSVVAADVVKSVVIERAVREPEPIDMLDGQGDTQEVDRAPAPVDARAAIEVRVTGGNLTIVAGGHEALQTTDGNDADGFSGPYWIAPTGDAVVAMHVRRGQRHPVHIVDAVPSDRLEPKLRTLDYTKPGDEIDVPTLRLFRLERKTNAGSTPSDFVKPVVREIAIDEKRLANPWSIDRACLISGGRELAFLFNQRGHQKVQLVALDLTSGALRTIAEESSPTFVDYTNKVWMHWLDATGELLWMTEKSGWNHIELIDVATGSVKRRVTEGAWNVRRVTNVDESARTIDIALMGRDSGQDPYHLHHARVSIDSGAIVMLTDGDGTCRIEYSPDRSALLSVRARADQPPTYELRRTNDGALVTELGTADSRAAVAAGWRAPERFVAKGRDGTTDIWGLVFRPSDFDPARKYPVIENIYAGPHGQHVPKWFELSSRSREYAELGAIVVQIDGMGTNWRGKAFHDVCWKNLKDAGFPDRIAWLRALAVHDRSVDLSRVGIFGGSAGGQNAMRAVLDHADFYKVAVADCGCHDNRMDKIWWNEQWMGWPVDESYVRSSNLEDAAKLGGALMLVVGGLDSNVDPATTMQVAQRLIDAGKDFELLVIPGAGHGCAESEYGNLRRAQFLFEHLGGPR
jgi:dipeptidyl aminopeptidase/acylaminoacyl peptidase